MNPRTFGHFQHSLFPHSNLTPFPGEYVLPDFVNIHRGYVNLPDVTDDPDEAKKPVPTKEQMIRLSLERFTVPEILFNPSDIGL